MTDPSSIALSSAVLGARLALAAMFAFAGVAKLRDPGGTASMLQDFGAPQLAARPFARALPLVELAVALALVPYATAFWGSLAALCLLAAFTAAIGANLLLGRKPECRCFGAVAAAPIGAWTLGRNAVLLAVAAAIGFALPATSDGVVYATLRVELGWAIATCVLLTLLSLQTFLMVQILRQQGRMLLRLEQIEGADLPLDLDRFAPQAPQAGLPIGSPAPDFALPSIDARDDGAAVTLQALRTGGKRVALFFAHPACGPCGALVPQIAAWQRDLASALTVAVISEGTAGENRRLFAEHGMRNVLIQTEHEVSDAYRSWGTPAAVIVEADGTLASGVAAGADAIRELIASAADLIAV